MSEVTAGVKRDELGNPIGANVTVKNDDWTFGGSARTDQAELYIQNHLLKGTVNYTSEGIGMILSGGVNNLEFAAGFTPAGQPTGTATAKFGSASLSIVPDGVTGKYEHAFAGGTLTGSYTSSSNTWALNVRNTGADWGYAIQTGYSSLGGFSFFGSIFNTGF